MAMPGLPEPVVEPAEAPAEPVSVVSQMESFLDATDPEFGGTPPDQDPARPPADPPAVPPTAAAPVAEPPIEEPTDPTADPPDPTADPPAEPEPEPKEDGIRTLGELAQHFELELPIFEQSIFVEIAGKEVALSALIEEARSGHDPALLDKAVQAKQEELSGLITQRGEEFDGKLLELQTALKSMLGRVKEHSRTPEEWAALRESDPIAYATSYTDYQQEREAAQNALNILGREAQEREVADAKQHNAWRADQGVQLRTKATDWVEDSKLMEREILAIDGYLKNQGFTQEELEGSLQDHRYVLVARDAARWRALQAKSALATKRVRATPQRVIRPGARADADETAGRRLDDALKRHGSSKSVTSAAAAIYETL